VEARRKKEGGEKPFVGKYVGEINSQPIPNEERKGKRGNPFGPEKGEKKKRKDTLTREIFEATAQGKEKASRRPRSSMGEETKNYFHGESWAP